MNKQFTTREMRAIKDLLIGGEGGVNISSLVDDLTSANDSNPDKDVMGIKVALLLTGKVPAFEPYRAYIKNWNTVYTIEVLEESSLNNRLKYRTIDAYKKNDQGHYVKIQDYQSTETTCNLDHANFSDKVDVELYTTDPDA